MREHLAPIGSKKKGRDHGPCGARAVLIEGRSVTSCLTRAAMHDGDTSTTIEGMARGDTPHPLKAAFVHHDGFRCGYRTPRQIGSAADMLAEHEAGMPSVVTADLVSVPCPADDETRERMSGNIRRRSAYPNNILMNVSTLGRALNGNFDQAFCRSPE